MLAAMLYRILKERGRLGDLSEGRVISNTGIETDVKERGFDDVDWVHLAQDRVQ
jgi:hypothetical protein